MSSRVAFTVRCAAGGVEVPNLHGIIAVTEVRVGTILSRGGLTRRAVVGVDRRHTGTARVLQRDQLGIAVAIHVGVARRRGGLRVCASDGRSGHDTKTYRDAVLATAIGWVALAAHALRRGWTAGARQAGMVAIETTRSRPHATVGVGEWRRRQRGKGSAVV